MAEAIFTSKKIEEFAFQYSFTRFATIGTIFTGFSKNFLMSNRPRNASDWNGKYKKYHDLPIDYLHFPGVQYEPLWLVCHSPC